MASNSPNYAGNNSLATTSMVSGIVGWVFFLLNLCLNFLIIPALTVVTLGLGGLFWICAIPLYAIPPIGWLVGVITGHVARNKIRETGEGGSGMATSGLIMGYIGLALVVITLCLALISFLFVGSVPFLGALFSEY